MGVRIRALGVVLVALVAATLASTATAAPSLDGDRALDRRSATATSVRVPSNVRRALRSSVAPAAAQAQRAVRRSFASGSLGAVSQLLPEGEYGGFAYCGNDVAYVWPADAPNHDMTATRTTAVFSDSADFSDPEVIVDPWYVLQFGTDFYLYDPEAGEIVYGPTEYADAWLPWYLPDNSRYVVFLQNVVTVDGGVVTGNETVLAETVGPRVHTPYVCQP